MTAGTVLPAFFVIGIAFIPVGIGLLYFSDEVNEYVHDYTVCNKTDKLQDLGVKCSEEIKAGKPCICYERFELKTDFKVCILQLQTNLLIKNFREKCTCITA